MTRMGMYTGRLYSDEDFQRDRIQECCRVLTSEEEKSCETMWVLSIALKKKCAGCYGCPESRREKP